jgi:heparan-alpha-glucosaminide N-acetyltransferase
MWPPERDMSIFCMRFRILSGLWAMDLWHPSPWGVCCFPRLFLNGDVAISIREKMLYSTVFTILMLLAGWLLMPFGLAKIGATPSWCLYSAAICVIIFMALYWIVDIHKQTSWAVFMKPAGSNPLLTYILPDIYYASFGFYHFMGIAGEGWPGVVKSIIFSLFILGISALMTRWKIRLQL